ncbi:MULTISPECIES: hypothetical protein [Pseudomonas]|nr:MULTISPECIES: hypothetical protein [Pseudomonas]MCF4987164.1 hypothetical protein [Pseudomonas syringae]MCF5202959.1 hypothetical protein [Pseudomonas syringae]MCF5270395.1 hypothetical protein [Pseudomonas syringae]MCF5276326.1 hypothetical protein [Pseudomonas syringae]MCF5283195.1 hypothetical protein [Pseudomonas syringae]
MKLAVNDIDRANLAWICDVFVIQGDIKDPGITEFRKLIVAERPGSVKPSRMDETTLKITVEEFSDAVLGDIKDRLLKNESLSEAHKAIREGRWYRSTMEITVDQI